MLSPHSGTDIPIAMVTPSGGSNTRSYFHTNRQGSTIAMSADNGTMSEGPYTYDAYGNGASATGVPFKYTGRRLDPGTGLYYYRARYYSAGLGRFLQIDLVGYADQMNLYAYAGSDPLNAYDPSGMKTWVVLARDRDGKPQHTAVIVERGGIDGQGDSTGDAGKPTMYDPNGSGEMIGPNGPGGVEGLPGSVNGNIQVGDNVTVENYVKTQVKEYPNITSVTVFEYDTTAEQEARIIQNALRQGDGTNVSCWCTCSVARVISGVGPIPNVLKNGTPHFPSTLRDRLRETNSGIVRFPDGRVQLLPMQDSEETRLRRLHDASPSWAH